MSQKMKTNKNKKKRIPSSATWPDLPQQLVHTISKQPALLQHITQPGLTKLCASLTKSCRPTNSRKYCNRNNSPPSLQLLLVEDETNNNSHTFLNPSLYSNWSWYRNALTDAGLPVPFNRWWYLTKRFNLFLSIPSWDERIPFTRVVITSSPRSIINKKSSYGIGMDLTVMVLTGIRYPAFVFYRLGAGRGWVKQDCTLKEPHYSIDSQRNKAMTFTNAIGFNGKFYVLSLQGTIAVIEGVSNETDNHPRITTLSTERAVPCVLSKYFKEYLVESDGKILLVFLISRKSIKAVDDVQVMQLDTTKLSWTNLKSLGKASLFLGANCCMSVCGSDVGFRKNCIYFTNHAADDGWWVFDMENRCISSDSIETIQQ